MSSSVGKRVVYENLHKCSIRYIWGGELIYNEYASPDDLCILALGNIVVSVKTALLT